MKKCTILAMLLMAGSVSAMEAILGDFRLTAGGSMRMNFKTKTTFTGKGMTLLPTGTPSDLYDLGVAVGGDYDDWRVHESLVSNTGDSFTIAQEIGVGTMTSGTLDQTESAMALDLDLSTSIYSRGGFTLLAGIGFSYMPKQTLLDGKAPGSMNSSATTTTYDPVSGGTVEVNQDADGNYHGKPLGGFGSVVVTPGASTTVTQSFAGSQITSELEASELRLIMQPEYAWTRVTLGLRTGVALGYASSETRAGLMATLNNVSQAYSFEETEEKVYAQLLLGLSLSFACTDAISLFAWADARLGGPALKTETGPYQTEIDLDHYAIGLALEYRF